MALKSMNSIKKQMLQIWIIDGYSRSEMAKVPDCSFEVSEFELQSHYYFHFRTITLEKVMNPFNKFSLTQSSK